MKTKNDEAKALAEIIAVLEPFDEDDQLRVMAAACLLTKTKMPDGLWGSVRRVCEGKL